jgi:hypothetical protein
MVRYRICLLLTSALVLTATAAGGQPPEAKSEKLSAKELESLWADLAGKDAAKAYRAIWALAGTPRDSVPFLKERLKPVAGPQPGVIERLITDLDSKRFPEREKAMSELEKLGPLAVPALERARDQKPSLEMLRRIERLLERAAGLTLSADELRVWRALEAIEHMRTAEANALLEVFARGAPGAWPTEEAKAALKRLAKLKTVTP